MELIRYFGNTKTNINSLNFFSGDCDCNADCRAGLVCGSNNCPGRALLGFGGGFDLTDDCCCMPNVAVEQGGCGIGVKVEEDETCKK